MGRWADSRLDQKDLKEVESQVGSTILNELCSSSCWERFGSAVRQSRKLEGIYMYVVELLPRCFASFDGQNVQSASL